MQLEFFLVLVQRINVYYRFAVHAADTQMRFNARIIVKTFYLDHPGLHALILVIGPDRISRPAFLYRFLQDLAPIVPVLCVLEFLRQVLPYIPVYIHMRYYRLAEGRLRGPGAFGAFTQPFAYPPVEHDTQKDKCGYPAPYGKLGSLFRYRRLHPQHHNFPWVEIAFCQGLYLD